MKPFDRTVPALDLDRFMGRWYVISARPTFLEDGAHNAIENYTWLKDKQEIQIDFTFNKGAFDGKSKHIRQRGWIQNQQTKAHWIVSPFWPLKFDFLILALAQDYSWTAVGVANQKYLWVMARQPVMSEEQLASILKQIADMGYRTDSLVRIPHRP